MNSTLFMSYILLAAACSFSIKHRLFRDLDDAPSVNTDVTMYSPINCILYNNRNVKLRYHSGINALIQIH